MSINYRSAPAPQTGIWRFASGRRRAPPRSNPRRALAFTCVMRGKIVKAAGSSVSPVSPHSLHRVALAASGSVCMSAAASSAAAAASALVEGFNTTAVSSSSVPATYSGPSLLSGVSLNLFAPLALWLLYARLPPPAFAWLGRLVCLAAALGAFLRGMLEHNFYLPSGRRRRALVAWPQRKLKLLFRQMVMGAVTSKLLRENHWAPVRPTLDAARRVTPADFSAADRVNARADAIDEWKLFEAPEFHERVRACMADSLAGDESNEAVEQRSAMLDALVARALEHVEIPGRGPLTLDDCYIYSCAQERGAYFPHVHWDTDYMCFPEVDAFQIWYLIENERPTGNMFMARTATFARSDPPCRYLMQADGSVTKVLHDASDVEPPLQRFDSLEASGLRFEYLDMAPGECLVFSKRTLHLSDPRPHLDGEDVGRLAMNVRVLLRPADRPSFSVWAGHRYFQIMARMRTLLRRHVVRDADGGVATVHGYQQQVAIPSRSFLATLQ